MAINKAFGWAAVAAGVAAANADAQVKPEQVLARAPIQPGVVVSNPTPADVAGCKATEVSWPNSPAKGVVVTDAAGKKLRQFISTAGNGQFNIFSFYADGAESYREIVTDKAAVAGRPDQFRWLGVNGGKWGLDANGDGIIDEWIAISPEEVTQEVFAAVLAKDQRRLAALTVKPADLARLKVPEADAARIAKRTEAAPQRLAATVQGLALTDKAKLLNASFGAPHVTPADAFGGADDLVRHKGGTFLVEKGTDDKAATMVAVGELVQVGRAWKVIDGPSLGAPTGDEGGNQTNVVPPAIQKLVDDLIQRKPDGTTPAAVAKYQLERAAILEECVRLTKGAEQYPWLKQLVDAYQSAIETDPSKKDAMDRLTLWKGAILKTPANETHPYIVFRHAAAEYAVKFKEAKDADKGAEQVAYRTALEKFVKDYPTAEDAPEAMMRLAVAFEYAGKEKEPDAKGWYERLAKDFPAHPYAAKATGAVRRLASEGQPFALSGSTFDGRPFTAAAVAGKPVVVYYWASWGSGVPAELAALDALAKANTKGLQVVTVCLDDVASKATAEAMLKASGLAGFHLYAEGGLDASPLAAAYGIQMVPHIFLVDAAGKVANRNAQNGPLLKDDVEKMLK